ncbi:MAG TPA: hypothetical protein VFD48_09125, partial [Pyrinomonadaceae bacterium]|nr:hypothetical protein [Pyrinomonadaceae bacterium]
VTKLPYSAGEKNLFLFASNLSSKLRSQSDNCRSQTLEDEQPLTPTRGCVRVHNVDVNALITTVNDLATNRDAVTNIFIGDTPTLNAQANERDANGNYRYPQLRSAGFGTPDAQQRPAGNVNP